MTDNLTSNIKPFVGKEIPNIYSQNLSKYNNTDNLVGIVVNNEDSLKAGRCQIRVFGMHDQLKNDELPWAYPRTSTVFSGGETGGAGSFIYPKLNHLVNVYCQDEYTLFYTAIIGLNKKMQSEFSNSYENVQVVAYDEDEDLKIIYTKEKGILVWYKNSFINIDKTQHINIYHKDGASKINLIDGDVIEYSQASHYIDSPAVKVGKDASNKDTKCNALFDLLDKLGTIIDAKIPANPMATNLIKAYKMQVCSQTVKIAD